MTNNTDHASLAHDTIPVPIPHERVRRMRAPDRRDTVAARLLAGDHPVSIVIVECEGIGTGRRPGTGAGPRSRRRRAHDGLQSDAVA